MGVKATIYIADSRNMAEVEDESVDLIVTSPPYWNLKDYGVENQIGYGQTLWEYLIDLSRVWRECWRVLRPGRRLCINIGDQFARAIVYGSYRVIPIHAEMISQCESIGFDYMGSIIWQKKTTMRTTGGAVVMGSFPYPPNGIVELDYEYILLFKKPGRPTPVPKHVKEISKLSLEEWKEFFSGHWNFAGERQILHEAMFPEELPRRILRMFSFPNETVLDPFCGSGTTIKVALELNRNAVGYEIQPEFIPIMKQKLGIVDGALLTPPVTIVTRQRTLPPVDPPPNYKPQIKNAKPIVDPKKLRLSEGDSHRVVEIVNERTVKLENGSTVQLAGITVPEEKRDEVCEYLKKFVLGKKVVVRFYNCPETEDGVSPAYLYLSNGLFVNRKMIEMGLARADSQWHPYLEKFLKIEVKTRG